MYSIFESLYTLYLAFASLNNRVNSDVNSNVKAIENKRQFKANLNLLFLRHLNENLISSFKGSLDSLL